MQLQTRRDSRPGRAPRMISGPKSFGAKLLFLFLLVVAAAQFTTWFIVSRANRSQAKNLIEEELRFAATAFNRIVAERNLLLTAAAAAAARGYDFKQQFGGETVDAATLSSTLESLALATRADVVTVLNLDATIMASSPKVSPSDVFAQLVARADADPSPNPTAVGYGYLDAQLYSVSMAPVRTPDIIAWLVIGFRIDRAFATLLKEQTGIDVTFLDRAGRPLATTLPERTANFLMAELPALRAARGNVELSLGGEAALVATSRLGAGETQSATLVLQYSLDEKLRPAREAERLLLFVAFSSLIVAGIISRLFARRLSQPIEQLAAHTRVIAVGDYVTPLELYRGDELGRLADAFRAMSTGLAERDRVRDLLDKNVSPEVAAQLLRDGATLGGEEREVTILFADLRGFTTLSEKFAPRDLLHLLNRYLDRMSAAIEHEGGVIDKFIGDAIMALFGAPVPQAQAARRAVNAAIAMERALIELNHELAAEGHPPLAIGIGINTARVVAGNIGSQRRLNYSVIGDGVNVAARLQSETRNPDYATNVIISAATRAALGPTETSPGFAGIRELGPVRVKGRAAPVEIFAVGS